MACDLNFSAEQRQILEAVASLLETHFPVARLPDPLEPITDIADFGAFALALDVERGGAGFTLVEEVLMHVLFGRHLVPVTALAAPVAVRLALDSGDVGMAETIAAGDLVVTVAVAAGGATRIFEAGEASHAVVFGDRRLGLVCFSDNAGTRRAGMANSFFLRDLAAEELHAVTASTKPSIIAVADLLVSAQLLGISQACRDLAVTFAGVRRQFGKPIGAFQAIKHHCANMAVSAELLSAQLDMAAISERDGREDAAFQVASARILAPRAALDNARICVQVHGAMGFSAEAEPHRYVKQAHVLRLLGGGFDVLDHASPMAPFRTG